MWLVLGIATVLGVAGLIASCGLFYLGERVWHLSRDAIQTLMYLKLSWIFSTKPPKCSPTNALTIRRPPIARPGPAARQHP